MDMIISLLVLSALPQLVAAEVPQVNSIKPVLELVSKDARIFSGESACLKCSIPRDYKLSWTFLWFRGSEQLPQVSEHLHLWNSKVKDSGQYYCQGVRDSQVGDIHTMKSLPLEINVDGGWSILKVPLHPSFVGNDLNVTCRVRDEPKLHEVILYKDRVEVMRQKGPDTTFLLPNLTLEDQGWYSCRASWDFNRQTHSVISAEVPVNISVILSQPVLEIVEDRNLMLIDRMKLVCHVQYNAPDPAPPVHYYFYEGDYKLGTATSENYDLVNRAPGQYRCRVKVPQLGLSRWSEPQSFGQETGPKTMMPPVLRPRDPWPLGTPVPSPDPSLRPTTEPTTARPSPQGPSSSSPLMPPTDISTHPSDLLPNAYPSTPSTILTTVKPIKQTGVPTPADRYEESGEKSGESTDLPEGSGSMVDDFDDMPEESGDMPDDFDDVHGKADEMPQELTDFPEGSGDVPDDSDGMLEGSGDVPDDSDDMLEGSGDILEDLLDTVLDQHVPRY